MKEFNEDFIKDTAQQFADSQQFKIDHKYDFKSVETGYVEGFKKALELVKNNGVSVLFSREQMIDFADSHNPDYDITDEELNNWLNKR